MTGGLALTYFYDSVRKLTMTVYLKTEFRVLSVG
jgi:hypothetical protein